MYLKYTIIGNLSNLKSDFYQFQISCILPFHLLFHSSLSKSKNNYRKRNNPIFYQIRWSRGWSMSLCSSLSLYFMTLSLSHHPAWKWCNKHLSYALGLYIFSPSSYNYLSTVAIWWNLLYIRKSSLGTFFFFFF